MGKSKLIILIVVALILTVFFGTFPLSILSKIWDFLVLIMRYIGKGIEWIAKSLDLFGWNGIV